MNTRQFATIMGVSNATVYLIKHPNKKAVIAKNKAKKENREVGEKKFIGSSGEGNFEYYKNDKGRIAIDIDNFIESNKLWEFETLDPPFSNRIFKEEIIVPEDIPEEMTKTDLMKYFGMTIHKILAMRQSGEVPFERRIINERKVKNVTTYIYKKSDILDYAKKHGIPLISRQPEMRVEKMFYSIEDIHELLVTQHDINVNISTINRKITKNNLLPAIRVAAMIRIPILEFEKTEAWRTFLHSND